MHSQIHVDFGKEVGRIKPIHCVNNGPVQGMNGGWNASHYFRAMNIPYARLHDTDYPYGMDQHVDIHCIFPDFDADETLESSYYFSGTDTILKGIVDAGGEPFYRLGESIDHNKFKRFVYAPKDAAKWARICEHIIRHYNEGWADGFHFGITYWEIWNEPEGKDNNMWIGTWEQYYELYSVTAHHLKRCFGDSIKVGGFAATNINYLFVDEETPRQTYCREFGEGFFAYIKKTNAPLDFFSYHKYNNEPRDFYPYNNRIRQWLDEKGYPGVELILNEWHNGYFQGIHGRKSTAMAAETGMALICAQKSAVDMMMYYDLRRTTTFNSLVSLDYQPMANYFPFVMFGKLYALGSDVDCGEYDIESPVAWCAAKGDGKGGIMVTNMRNDREPVEYRFRLKGWEQFRRIRVEALTQRFSSAFPTTFLDIPATGEFTLRLEGYQSLAYVTLE